MVEPVTTIEPPAVTVVEISDPTAASAGIELIDLDRCLAYRLAVCIPDRLDSRAAGATRRRRACKARMMLRSGVRYRTGQGRPDGPLRGRFRTDSQGRLAVDYRR
jgi:hypothetical protein